MEKSSVNKVINLKPGMENVNLRVRVLRAGETKVIQTRKGVRTISEAIVGDESGRVKLTLWGRHAGTIEEGTAIEVKGAFTTQYRGEVQLNLGSKGSIEQISEELVPSEEDIPEATPKAPYTPGRGGYQRRASGMRGGSYTRRKWR